MEDGMTARIAALLLLGVFALAPGLAAADETHSLEQVLVEIATTPAEHAALANHYRSKAADARAEAREHDTMARTYVPTGHTKFNWGMIAQRQQMANHCKKISQQSEANAQDYEALAKLHDEEAKKAE